MDNRIYIDGSFGEGGGQILRSSLSLSMITGIPFEMKNIRAGRQKPGLMRQHLTCVKAAAEICDAQIIGVEVGSKDLFFNPGVIKGGDYTFAIGTAGSTMLVAQTVLPALFMADEKSTVTLRGGTHNMNAPPYDFIEQGFVPVLKKMGVRIDCAIEKYGFHPTGGGEVVFNFAPLVQLKEVTLMERKGKTYRSAEALVANLPADIAKRELAKIGDMMDWDEKRLSVRQVKGVTSSGNVVFIKIGHGDVTEIITSFGKVGLKSEKVAEQACKKAQAFLASDAVVGEYLADQILLPMALAGAGKFKTVRPSLHTKTNIEVIQKFLPCDIDIEEVNDNLCVISFDGEAFVNEPLKKKLEKNKKRN